LGKREEEIAVRVSSAVEDMINSVGGPMVL
jgi:hypothetical protein